MKKEYIAIQRTFLDEQSETVIVAKQKFLNKLGHRKNSILNITVGGGEEEASNINYADRLYEVKYGKGDEQPMQTKNTIIQKELVQKLDSQTKFQIQSNQRELVPTIMSRHSKSINHREGCDKLYASPIDKQFSNRNQNEAGRRSMKKIRMLDMNRSRNYNSVSSLGSIQSAIESSRSSLIGKSPKLRYEADAENTGTWHGKKWRAEQIKQAITNKSYESKLQLIDEVGRNYPVQNDSKNIQFQVQKIIDDKFITPIEEEVLSRNIVKKQRNNRNPCLLSLDDKRNPQRIETDVIPTQSQSPISNKKNMLPKLSRLSSNGANFKAYRNQGNFKTQIQTPLIKDYSLFERDDNAPDIVIGSQDIKVSNYAESPKVKNKQVQKKDYNFSSYLHSSLPHIHININLQVPVEVPVEIPLQTRYQPFWTKRPSDRPSCQSTKPLPQRRIKQLHDKTRRSSNKTDMSMIERYGSTSRNNNNWNESMKIQKDQISSKNMFKQPKKYKNSFLSSYRSSLPDIKAIFQDSSTNYGLL